jgi:hypothetical protein
LSSRAPIASDPSDSVPGAIALTTSRTPPWSSPRSAPTACSRRSAITFGEYSPGSGPTSSGTSPVSSRAFLSASLSATLASMWAGICSHVSNRCSLPFCQ